MIVAACELDLRLTNHPRSLKEKRMVIQSLKEKLRNRFKVSVSEIGSLELWQRCQLGIACVNAEAGEARSLMDQVVNYVDQIHDIEIINSEIHLY